MQGNKKCRNSKRNISLQFPDFFSCPENYHDEDEIETMKHRRHYSDLPIFLKIRISIITQSIQLWSMDIGTYITADLIWFWFWSKCFWNENRNWSLKLLKVNSSVHVRMVSSLWFEGYFWWYTVLTRFLSTFLHENPNP